MLITGYIVLMALVFVGVTTVAIRDEIKFKGNVPANYRFTLQFFTAVFAIGGAFVIMVVKG